MIYLIWSHQIQKYFPWKEKENSTNDKQGYITLKEATNYCNYSLEYLSLLARTGRLSAVKFNRNWMTTIQAIETYLDKMGLKKSCPPSEKS